MNTNGRELQGGEVWRSRHPQVKLTLWCLTDIALSPGVFHSCPLAFIRGSNESFRINHESQTIKLAFGHLPSAIKHHP
jgi:hypothetical protein